MGDFSFSDLLPPSTPFKKGITILLQKETVYFCDFDGTIAIKDIGNELHKRFSAPQWRVPNQAYLSGKISSRDCLSAQYEFFRGRREEIEAFVLEHEIDSTFVDFVGWAQEAGCPVIILSDGLDFYIELLLRKYGLEHLPYFSNRAHFWQDRISVSFPHFRPDCSHQCQCGNCKPSHLEPYAGYRRVYVGDGVSDRYAAHSVETIYAKRRLEEYCRAKQIPYVAFHSFQDIQVIEEGILRGMAVGE